MGTKSRRYKSTLQFVVGSHGGCEALLFEFRERMPRNETTIPLWETLRLLEQNTVRIAATTLDEALAYLRWGEPEFAIESVRNLGVILMVSGSPVD
jgi:hypothetical protein